jgi:hypothetical protein
MVKEGTGNRWGSDYGGVLVIGKTFWEIFGVEYGDSARVAGQLRRREKHGGRVSSQPQRNAVHIFSLGPPHSLLIPLQI